MALSEDGLVATKNRTGGTKGFQLVTGGEPMTEGRHYWELELTSGTSMLIGAVRPGLDHDKGHDSTIGGYDVFGLDGTLYGNGKSGTDKQGKFATGDRIGVLLDLDAGWMRIYRNGKRCGPGFTEGVTGPLVRAAKLINPGNKLTVLPGAVAPVGAGADDEHTGYFAHTLAQLKDTCRAKGLPVGGTKAVLRARLEAAPPPQ
jgi:hypothetical protein